MPFPCTPCDLLRLQIQTGLMLMEAQTVMTLRLWGMMGLWNTTPAENRRMVREKAVAAASAGRAAGTALWRGQSAPEVALAALKPVRRRTRSNLRRLGALGAPGQA